MRNCKNYNPEADMIKVTGYDGSTQLYLEVKYRVRWFHEFCEENGIEGYIDDSDIRYIQEAGLLIATATVYMNGQVAGKSTAGIQMDTLDSFRAGTIVQTIATQAKGRALANAGFGTTNVSGSEEGDKNALCDAGIPISPAQAPSAPVTPVQTPSAQPTNENKEPEISGQISLMPDGMPAPDPAPVQQPVVSSAPIAEDAPVTEEAYQKALATVIPMGTYKGKTFQQALGENPGIAKFYSTRFNNQKYPEVKAAAQIICRYQDAL